MHSIPVRPAPSRVSSLSTVNEILARYPGTMGICNAFGLDTCCGGALSLRDAAAEAGANLEQLLVLLETEARASDADNVGATP
jgi:iron-sulfur cluster repair protein YtfE (RIC family)